MRSDRKGEASDSCPSQSVTCPQKTPCLVTKTASTMPETAEAHSVTLATNRNCTIEITNVSAVFCLVNPKVHMESGFSFSPPQPTVRTTKTEVCSFIKDDNTATGAVGVLTYEMFHMREQSCSELIAIMFSVPFDYTFYKNWLGVGIFDKARGCDDKLFDHMYNSKDFTSFVRQEASGSGVLYQGKEVDVRACMSNEGKAIIKLELYDKMGR
ncbi:Hemolytic toxin Avt-1 [Oryzias melastigma]|uniref:Bryoporin-like n=1 Tax=Oryzias melastigma TaxID=30732 RepID=A0A3B3CMM8_ORYME|nr:bryoporin isoform X1 [Oryzias melastigma]KAF6739359.1 Hemolytic toxin Avt-1 [Oryzias melastigma]